MPFALGLDIPEWDDAGAPATGLKKPKAQKRALPLGASRPAVPAAAAAAAAAPQRKGAAAAAALSLGTPRKAPSDSSLAALGTAPATTGKADRKRKHEGPVGTASSSPVPASTGGGGERGPAGAKKKKRKGKHGKHKRDGGGDTASANGSPVPKGAQQPRETTEKERLRPQQQAVVAAAASDAEHGQAGEAGKQVKKKKRKRKNKFLATGEDADASAQGAARPAGTPDQLESSRKKQKLERRQASGSGSDSPAAAGARSSASKRKEKMTQKSMGNVATAGSAERVGQAAKDAGVVGQVRGREGGGKTGANVLKAKERSEEREEKTEGSTHSKFPFHQMSSIASNRKLTPLQVL